MAVVLQVPGHLPDTVEWGLQDLLVDQVHQGEVQFSLARRLVAATQIALTERHKA